MSMIITSECSDCVYGEIIEKSKRDIWVHCDARDKMYRYGQCVPCEDKKKIKKNN